MDVWASGKFSVCGSVPEKDDNAIKVIKINY